VVFVLSGNRGGTGAGGTARKITACMANWSCILGSSKFSPEDVESECEYCASLRSGSSSLAIEMEFLLLVRESETLSCGPVVTTVTETPPLLFA